MRVLIKNAINKEDHDALLNTKDTSFVHISGETNPTILKIIGTLKEHFDFTIKPESYWRIEHTPNGHDWHVDTGTNNHMMWCQVGCSILLTSTRQFEGGETLYNQEEPITVERDLYDIAAHSSDEWHKVNSHSGKRVVLLLFI
jgi:hypothetical protein